MVKRIGVEDKELTFEQAAEILKMVDEVIGDDFLSFENFKSTKRPTPSRIFQAIQSSRMRLALKPGMKPSKTPVLKLCRIIAADQRGQYKQQSPESRGFCIVASPRS